MHFNPFWNDPNPCSICLFGDPGKFDFPFLGNVDSMWNQLILSCSGVLSNVYLKGPWTSQYYNWLFAHMCYHVASGFFQLTPKWLDCPRLSMKRLQTMMDTAEFQNWEINLNKWLIISNIKTWILRVNDKFNLNEFLHVLNGPDPSLYPPMLEPS